ncbi:helix-turn-helix transcriptional regulator [Oceanobacillus jeddahense]|nr:helix-turn-helix transcriptional regulator [Oceanobacillus jeddahense]
MGINIRNKRKSLKLSQEYIAEQLQVSRQAVSKWEMGPI